MQPTANNSIAEYGRLCGTRLTSMCDSNLVSFSLLLVFSVNFVCLNYFFLFVKVVCSVFNTCGIFVIVFLDLPTFRNRLYWIWDCNIKYGKYAC